MIRDVFWCDPKREFVGLFGRSPMHRRFHGRVVVLFGISVVIFLVATATVRVVDEDLESKPLTEALAWTASQMVSAGSSVTIGSPWAHLIEVFLQIYSITAIAALAGS